MALHPWQAFIVESLKGKGGGINILIDQTVGIGKSFLEEHLLSDQKEVIVINDTTPFLALSRQRVRNSALFITTNRTFTDFDLTMLAPLLANCKRTVWIVAPGHSHLLPSSWYHWKWNSSTEKLECIV